MPKKLNLIGKKFGKLTIISEAKHNGRSKWNAVCECGNKTIIVGANLSNGHTRSCGCLWKEATSKSKKNLSHGMYKTRFYHTWANVKYRCNSISSKDYKRYGLRGIKLSKSWHKFENFKDDMYESYLEHVKKYGEKQTTIDRINNNGNYCKQNCRWATYKVQNNNR